MPGQVDSWQKGESSSSRRVTQPTPTTGYMTNSQNSRTKMADSKAVFGWTTIDGIRFPYLMREDKKFVAVRMVEMKLLSKYPSTYPDELKNRPPLMSHYVTDREIKLLNEINKEHCAGEYGNYEFSSQDLIVKLEDFEEFYNIVKKHFPDEVLKNLPQKSRIDGGWVQVNNTVVPFVFRNDFRFVPLSVIRYAAQLLVDVDVQGHVPTDDECKYFNNICKTAGLNFKFGKSTKLVMLNMVQTVSTTAVVITELPKEDPFGAAEFKGEEQEITRLPTQIAPESIPAPPVSIPSGIPSTMAPGMAGLPPGMVPPTSMMPGFPPSATPYWMNPHMGIFPGFGPGSGAGPVPNPFLMQQNHKGQISPHGEVNNNGAVKDFPERPSSRGSNPRGTPTSIGRRSSTGTPSPTGQGMYGPPPLRAGAPSAAAGAPPPHSMGMPPPGLLASHGLMAGNRMMFPMLPNQSPSDYQKLLQMVQMQYQPMKSQGPKGPPPLVPADPYATSRRMSTEAPPNVTVSRTSSIPKQGSRPRGRPPIISADEPKVKPQHSSRPITTAMANEPPAHQINPRVPIKRLDFEGKSMACLVKEGSCFALMEALSRVFFPYVPMDEFRYAVEMVLSVPVLTLTDEEEHAFIQFYGLPTSKLKCKKAIKLVDFSQYLPQLRYMYKEKADAAGFVGTNVSPPKGSSMPPNFLPPRFNNANNIRSTKSSPPKNVPSAAASIAGQSVAAANALRSLIENKNKRAADPPPAHAAPPKKKAKKRLDDMVNRLWSKNQSGSSSASATVSKRSNSETDSLSEPSTSPAAQTPMEPEEAMDQGVESGEETFAADDNQHISDKVTVVVPTDVVSEDGSSQGEENMEADDDSSFHVEDTAAVQTSVESKEGTDELDNQENVEKRAEGDEGSIVTEEEETDTPVIHTEKNIVNSTEATTTEDHSTKETSSTEEQNTDNIAITTQPTEEKVGDNGSKEINPEVNAEVAHADTEIAKTEEKPEKTENYSEDSDKLTQEVSPEVENADASVPSKDVSSNPSIVPGEEKIQSSIVAASEISPEASETEKDIIDKDNSLKDGIATPEETAEETAEEIVKDSNDSAKVSPEISSEATNGEIDPTTTVVDSKEPKPSDNTVATVESTTDDLVKNSGQEVSMVSEEKIDSPVTNETAEIMPEAGAQVAETETGATDKDTAEATTVEPVNADSAELAPENITETSETGSPIITDKEESSVVEQDSDLKIDQDDIRKDGKGDDNISEDIKKNAACPEEPSASTESSEMNVEDVPEGKPTTANDIVGSSEVANVEIADAAAAEDDISTIVNENEEDENVSEEAKECMELSQEVILTAEKNITEEEDNSPGPGGKMAEVVEDVTPTPVNEPMNMEVANDMDDKNGEDPKEATTEENPEPQTMEATDNGDESTTVACDDASQTANEKANNALNTTCPMETAEENAEPMTVEATDNRDDAPETANEESSNEPKATDTEEDMDIGTNQCSTDVVERQVEETVNEETVKETTDTKSQCKTDEVSNAGNEDSVDEKPEEMVAKQCSEVEATSVSEEVTTGSNDTDGDCNVETKPVVSGTHAKDENTEDNSEETTASTEANVEGNGESKISEDETPNLDVKDVKEGDILDNGKPISNCEDVENKADTLVNENSPVAVEGKVSVTEIHPEVTPDVKAIDETKELSDTNETASD